jgi:hypothetical protein
MRWGLAAVFVLTAAPRVNAQESTDIRLQCPSLGATEREELAARLALALRAAGGAAPRSLLVACDDTEVSLAWDAPPLELVRVPVRFGTVEDVLDAVDARLAGSKEPTAPTPELPVHAYEPTPGRRVFRTGGLGIGGTLEPLPFGVSAGPRWDVAVAAGAIAINLGEAVRFGGVSRTPYSSFAFQLDFGLSWGAPFDPDAWFGAHAAGGAEWFSVHGADEDIGTRTHAAAIFSMGPRVATEVGGLSLWLGLDGVLRPAPQSFGSPVNVELPRWSGSLSVGGVLLVDEITR